MIAQKVATMMTQAVPNTSFNPMHEKVSSFTNSKPHINANKPGTWIHIFEDVKALYTGVSTAKRKILTGRFKIKNKKQEFYHKKKPLC